MTKLHDVPKDPAELLLRVIKNDPRASEKEVRDTVLDNFTKAHFVKVFDYWFGNLYPRVKATTTRHGTTTTIEPAKAPHTRPGATAAAASRRKTAAERFKAILLMDLTLSTGKALRNSTFAECEREGGWLLDVAKQGKPNAIVGKHLTETDLRNLHGRNSRDMRRTVSTNGAAAHMQ